MRTTSHGVRIEQGVARQHEIRQARGQFSAFLLTDPASSGTDMRRHG